MTDATRIATLEAQIEVVALARDECREMLRELGMENAHLRANVYLLREAVEDHRRELKRLSALYEEEGTPAMDIGWAGAPALFRKGYISGVEAAARKVEGTYGLGLFKTAGIQNNVAADIRALSPSPATPSEERCTACGHDASWHIEPNLIVSGIGGECRKEGCRCGGSGRATPRGDR